MSFVSGFATGALSRARNYVADAAAVAGGAAADVARNTYHAAASAGGYAVAAAGGAAAAVTSRAAQAAIQVGLFSQLPQRPTPLIDKATDLLHLTSKVSRAQGDPKLLTLLDEKIVDLAAVLRSSKKNKEASQLVAEQKAIPAYKEQRKADADAKIEILRRSPLKAIHDLCSSVIRQELCRKVRSCLGELKDKDVTVWFFTKKTFSPCISRLRDIYQGSILDLPFSETETLLEYTLSRSLCTDLMSFPFELINGVNLSEGDKANVVEELIFSESLDSQEYHSSRRKFIAIKKAIDKGADPAAFEQWSQTPKCREELIQIIDGLGNLDDVLPCVQLALSRGFVVRAEEGASLLKQTKEKMSSLKSLYGNEDPADIGSWAFSQFYQFLELVIDFGGDPSEVIDRGRFDAIQKFIKGRNSEEIDDQQRDRFIQEQNKSIKEKGLEFNEERKLKFKKWEFNLIRRWNSGIYRQAQTRASVLNNPLYSAIHAAMGQQEEVSSAAAGGAANGGPWPRELFRLVGSYCPDPKLTAQEVQKLRDERAQSDAECKGAGGAAKAASAGGAAAAAAGAAATTGSSATSGAAYT